MSSTFAIMGPVRRGNGNGDTNGQPRVYLLIECPEGGTGRPGSSGAEAADQQALRNMVSSIPLVDIVSRLRALGIGDVGIQGPARPWQRSMRDGSSRPEMPSATSTKCAAIAAHRTPPSPAAAPDAGERRLTARQYEILMALKNGASNKEIGRRLGILESTVKVQLKSIYRELQVKNRTQAAMLAAQHERDRSLRP